MHPERGTPVPERSSIPASVTNPQGKVPGLYPSLTIEQWNAVVDVLTAEELSATPNVAALYARTKIRAYLVGNGYRNPNVA
jgi:hypothetical protein